jgi:hypothetical protein
MGNRNNREQWAGLERLRFIESHAFWLGVVNRSAVIDVFGISSAQASGDFQSYHEVNPEALSYNLNRKRYEASRDMKLVYGPMPLEEAIQIFLGESTLGVGRWQVAVQNVVSKADVLSLPRRQADLTVERCIFIAVYNNKRVRIKYNSMHGSTAKWRWIQPHAFAHNGHRWHVRAWCEENNDYRDFVLARISEIEWPVATEGDPLPPDSAWQKIVTLKLKPHSDLTEEQRQTVMLEYGMTAGDITIKCRQAMEPYLRAMLQLPSVDGVEILARLEVK